MSPLKVLVEAKRPYEVTIGHGLLDEVGALALGVHPLSRVALLTDSNVAPLYLERCEASLHAAGFEVITSIIPAGEESKSFASLERLMNEWSVAGLHRSDFVLALGGGVVGDLAGFAAACYQRGIPFVQVPTTLLAAVDSSVGGKTAIDIEAGKNLVGAFHQPLAVICDVDLIKTMPSESFSDGVAETIKYGVLGEVPLFDRVAAEALKQDSADLDKIVEICVRHKAMVVHDDEFEKGSRQLLNLGHTLAHAIEHLSSFGVTHGHAVAIGLAMMARATEKTGWSEAGTAVKIEAILKENHLPIATNYDANAMCDICRRDKKAHSDAITIVVPEKIGHCSLKKVSYEDLLALIELGKETL